MGTILNWNKKPITVASSKGGTLATANPYDNLIMTGVSPWPPPEITQKLYRSRQVRAFEGPDLNLATQCLGYYSDLQSIHSEDAITWSFLGTLNYATQQQRTGFVKNLLGLLEINVSIIDKVNIWLWRRIPHPDTLVSGGPEIDFGIQTEKIVIFGEAKWLSGVGQLQGKRKDKDQIVLRQEFFQKYAEVIFPEIAHYVVLGLSLRGNMLRERDVSITHATIRFRDLRWEQLCNIKYHPLETELKRYLKWKEMHSKT